MKLDPAKQKVLFTALFFLGCALFLVGQFVFFTSNTAVGLVLSFAGVFFGGLIYFKGDVIALPDLPAMPEMKMGGKMPKVGLKLPPISRLKLPTSPAAWKLEPFKPKYGFYLAGILLSLILIGIGQALFRQAWNDSTLAPGAWLYLAAAVVFVVGCWPWFREGLKNLNLSFQTEMIALGLILALAAFLRLYHIGSMPQGLFIDQGFVGYSARRILHESGYHPFYISEIFLMAYAMTLYQVAIWFKFFGENEMALRTFYVFLAMLGLPLIYWTFRQLAGPRMALATLFILAVMRWHIIFSRNQFPTIQVPLYMFATLAFLLYGLNNAKRWAFVTAGVLFGLGFYTYQGFKIMPVLLVVYTAYEFCADRKRILKNWKNILFFLGVAVIVTSPILTDMVVHKNFGDRESQVSIFTEVSKQHSMRPFWEGALRTSLMFGRKGDPNARHNLQDFQMLDDISAALFVLGLGYGIAHIKRRKYFYAVTGFFVTSLLCLLTIDAAHANRMLATTPFMAFLIATPVAVIWARVLKFIGSKAEWVFLVLLAPVAFFMLSQNWDVYFNKQGKSVSSWHEYAARETEVGRRMARYGSAYDYLVAPPYMGYHTINFLGYKDLDKLEALNFPEAIISHSGDPNRGVYFAVEEDRPAVAEMLKSYYPGAVDESLLDPDGHKAVYFLKVPADQLRKVLGLKAVFDRPVNGVKEAQIDTFPAGLPTGPYKATLTGNLFIDHTDDYRWVLGGNVHPTMWIGGRLASAAVAQHLEKGYYPVRIQISVASGQKPVLTIATRRSSVLATNVEAGAFNSLPPFRALKGSYYRDGLWDKEKPGEVRWDPILDFTDGNEFPTGSIYSIHWTGILNADQTGSYRFYIQSRAATGLTIDGKNLMPVGRTREGNGYLKAGPHKIDVYCVNPDLSFPYFALYWTKPDGTSEVIPNSAYGIVP